MTLRRVGAILAMMSASMTWRRLAQRFTTACICIVLEAMTVLASQAQAICHRLHFVGPLGLRRTDATAIEGQPG
jgi:hypothetical protein